MCRLWAGDKVTLCLRERWRRDFERRYNKIQNKIAQAFEAMKQFSVKYNSL